MSDNEYDIVSRNDIEEDEDEDTKILYVREWLNENEGTAYIIAEAEAYSKGTSISVSVQLKDCSRQIDLDFWFSDEKTRAEKLKKMDRLIAHLTLAREVIANHPLAPKEEKKKKTKVE